MCGIFSYATPFSRSQAMYDPLDDDRDPDNPVEANADDWAEFYAECERRTGMSFEEYLDHDQSMNG